MQYPSPMTLECRASLFLNSTAPLTTTPTRPMGSSARQTFFRQKGGGLAGHISCPRYILRVAPRRMSQLTFESKRRKKGLSRRASAQKATSASVFSSAGLRCEGGGEGGEGAFEAFV